MEKILSFFKVKEKGSSVKKEVMAGLTTFLTMAYIIALNPNLLTNFGASGGTELWNAVFMATILSSAIGTILMGLLANMPFALAPGMGLNSYFATVVASIAAAAGVTYLQGFQAGLTIILLEGIIFLVLSLFRVREKIVDAIPHSVRLGISAGIGLMLINIGLGTNDSIDTATGGPFLMLGTFFTQGPSATAQLMGEDYKVMVVHVITMLIGVLLIAVLNHKHVTGSILLGIAGASAFYWIMCFAVLGTNPFVSPETASWIPPFADMANLTLFKFDFNNMFSIGIFSAIMTIISFCIVDMFDTIGTLYGTCKAADMLDEDDKVPNMSQCLVSDAVATCVGAVTGTSTVTTFVESASGVKEGGRTGLASIVTGLLFLACMFVSPIAAIIPPPATSAALVFVGSLMIGSLREVDYSDSANTVPVIMMLIFMPISSSIGNGIGIGLVMYSLIKILRGEFRDVSVFTMILSVLFLCKFFIVF